MSRKENQEKVVKEKVTKKKKTSYEKRKLAMKIAGWLMAIVMLFGTYRHIVFSASFKFKLKNKNQIVSLAPK